MSFYTWFVWSSSNTALGWYVSQISLNLWWFFSFFIFCHLFGKGTGSFLTEFPTFRILLILPHVIILLHFFYFYTYCNLAVSSWLPLWLSSKELPAMQESLVQSLGWKDPLEKKMATHSSILAWEIPWTKEPGGLQSIGHKSRTQLIY